MLEYLIHTLEHRLSANMQQINNTTEVAKAMKIREGAFTPETASKERRSGPTETDRPVRVAIYVRISDRKADEYALDRQYHHFKEWVKTMPNHVIELVYQERNSAKGGVTRKEFNRLLRDGRSHRYDVVAFWHVDRFSRNVYEGLGYIQEWMDMGIAVYIAGCNMFYRSGDPAMTAMLQNMLIFAEFESSMTKLRTKEGVEAKLDKLKVYGDANGIKGLRCGIPSIIEMWIKDPFPKKDKRGWSVCADIEREELFRAIWNNPEVTSAYKEIKEHFRLPVIPDCVQSCHTFTDDGKPIYKSYDDYRKQKCYCGKIPSDKAVHKARIRLGLEPRKAHSWGRHKGPIEDVVKAAFSGLPLDSEGIGEVAKEEI